ncbi:MAG TPA: DNA recombination protein RmuC [Phycisphaerae bacterium]|nr:DNA recombination protein RmuC [Phycisphaerae bacterium]
MPTFWFVIGFAFGAVAIGAAWAVHARSSRRLAERMKETFAATAAEAMAANSRQLAEMAGGALEAKKALIDQSLTAMNERLERVRTVVQQIESERQKHYGELSERLGALASTTESLRQALAGSKRVGAWGERMTEDVLRMAGLQEGINYLKQSSASAESGTPDFTFILPNDLRVNMDVKFPLEKSLDYLDADGDDQRKAAGKAFIAAFRGHVKAVARRGYIDPGGGTADYVIVFVPNEQVYATALQLEPGLMDEAMSMKVVLASPLTLYAMLVVIRQAAQNTNILRTADEVIGLLGTIEAQWRRFKESMDRMGKRLDDAKAEYDHLVGARTRGMDRPLAQIEQLRSIRGLGDGGGKDDGDGNGTD